MVDERKHHALDKDLAEALGIYKNKKKKETGRDLSLDDVIREVGSSDPEFNQILREEEKKEKKELSLSDLF